MALDVQEQMSCRACLSYRLMLDLRLNTKVGTNSSRSRQLKWHKGHFARRRRRRLTLLCFCAIKQVTMKITFDWHQLASNYSLLNCNSDSDSKVWSSLWLVQCHDKTQAGR